MIRANWTDDEFVSACHRCRSEFSLFNLKHHCRNCGLIFCDKCSSTKMLIPEQQLVIRPPIAWVKQYNLPNLLPDEDNYRIPHRVCDPCSYQLREVQGELRKSISRYNQELTVERSGMMPSLPGVNFQLEQEINKAIMILKDFSSTSGEEKIPRELLDLAQGVVFLTIIKAGFMFTGRYGTGLIVTKLRDGTWSAPSAVMVSGVGWGMQIGAEVTDVMLILSSDAAVEAFKSKAQVAVGAELAVSVGPLGRSIASDVTAGTKGAAQAFSYAHSKGLFFGVSFEASAIAARTDVNLAFYGEKVPVSALLSGDYPKPKAAKGLYDMLARISDLSIPAGAAAAMANANASANIYSSSSTASAPTSSSTASSNPATTESIFAATAPVKKAINNPAVNSSRINRMQETENMEESEGHYL